MNKLLLTLLFAIGISAVTPPVMAHRAADDLLAMFVVAVVLTTQLLMFVAVLTSILLDTNKLSSISFDQAVVAVLN